MRKKFKRNSRRVLAFMLSVLTMLTAFGTSVTTTFAADGTLHFNSGETIAYGDYYTTRMTFDGENTAYCLEPLKKTPAAGEYVVVDCSRYFRSKCSRLFYLETKRKP